MNYIREGYNHVTPYLTVSDPDKIIEFLTTVLGAQIKDKVVSDNGKVMHAELTIGDSMIMTGYDKGTNETATLYVYVPDVDKTYQKALEFGTQSIREPEDLFYGDRSAAVKDKFGNKWYLATFLKK